MRKVLSPPTTLTQSSSRIVNRIALANRRLGVLSQSLSTGLNLDAPIINQTFGRSANNLTALNDTVIGAAFYTKALLETASNILEIAGKTYQDAAEKVASVAALPDDKLAALQVSIDNAKKQGSDLLEHAHFDGRKLFDGELRAIQVQTGANGTQVTEVSIVKTTGENVVRSSVISKLNQWMLDNSDDIGQRWHYRIYYAGDTRAEIEEGIRNNRNLTIDSLDNVPVTEGGATGTGRAVPDVNLLTTLYRALKEDSEMQKFLDVALPNWVPAIAALGNAAGFYDPNGLQNDNIRIGDLNNVNMVPARAAELRALLEDNVETTIYKVDNTAEQNNAAQAIALDVTQNSVNIIEKLRSNIMRDIKNITANIDILTKTNEVTKEVGESFLNADVTDIAQQFSKTIQSMKVDGNLMRANTTQSSTIYNAVAAQLEVS